MNYALPSLSTELVHGPDELRRALRLLKNVQVQAISSVYKRIEDKTEGTLSSEVLVAVSIGVDLSLTELRELLSQVAANSHKVRWQLLLFNHDVHLDPHSPIPHPELQMDPLILRCAAEIQGGFEHPVLGRSLQELVKSSQASFGRVQFEFISRGEALLSSTEVP